MHTSSLLTLFSLLFLNLHSFASDRSDCLSTSNFNFNKILDDISAGVGKTSLKNGFYLTSYNLKIDEDCSNRIKISELEKFYRNTMAEGTACMDRLTTNGVGKLGSINNNCLVKLFEDKSNPPKLLCGGWPFGKDIWAVGSFPGSSKRHPYLWLGPEITKLIKNDPLELKATIFHEMLHNCGYTHSEGIEIPYTCEQCCFSKDLSPERKQSACNICGGKYDNEEDPTYIKDLFSWSRPHLNWANDMRQRVYLTSVKSKNLKTFSLVIREMNMKPDMEKKLIQVFTENSLEKKKIILADFQKNFTADIENNSPLKSFLEWMNR